MPETFTEEDFTGTTTAPVKFSENDFAEPAKFSEADFSNTPSLQPVFGVTPGELPPEPAPNRVPLAPVIPEAVANDPNREAHIAATKGIHSLIQVPRATGNTGFGPWRTMGPVGNAALNLGGGVIEGVTDPRYWLLGLLKPAAAIPAVAGLFAPPAVESLGQGIEATRSGDVQGAIEGYGNAALGLALTGHMTSRPAFGESPMDRIANEIASSSTPITAGTVAAMREAAVSEVPPNRVRIFDTGVPKPVESIPQAAPEVAATTEVPNAVQEQGANAGVLRPAQSEVGLPQVGARDTGSEAPASGATEVQGETPQATAGESPAEVTLTPEEKATAAPTGPAEPPPAIPSRTREPSPEESKAIGIKNAAVDAQRQQMGLPPRMEVLRKSNQRSWDDAMAEVAVDPRAGTKLVDTLTDDPKPLNDVENSLLLHELATRQHIFDMAEADLNRNPTPENRVAWELARDEWAKSAAVADSVGTLNARGLQSRKMMVLQDFSLAKMLSRKQAALGGEELTGVQKQAVETQWRKLKDLEESLNKREAAVADAERQKDEEAFYRALHKQTRAGVSEAAKTGKSPRQWLNEQADEARARRKEFLTSGKAQAADPLSLTLQLSAHLLDETIIGASHIVNGIADLGAWSSEMVKEFGDNIKPYLDDIFQRSKTYANTVEQKGENAGAPVKSSRELVSEAVAAKAKGEGLDKQTVYELVRSKINELNLSEGIEGFNTAFKTVTEDLQKVEPGITERAVRDLFTDYGKVRLPSQEKDLKTLREYRRLGQLVSGIEDIQAGKPPKATGQKRDQPTQSIREKTKQLKEELRKSGIQVTDPETQLKTSQQGVTTRLTNQIADLDKEIGQLQRGIVETKTKTGITYTPEMKALVEMRDSKVKVRDELKQALEGTKPRKGLTPEQLDRNAVAAAKRSMEEYERRVREKDFASRKNPSREANAEVKKARSDRDAAKTQYEDLRKNSDAAQLERNQAEKEALQKSIAETQRKITTGEPARGAPVNRPAAVAEIEQLKQQRDDYSRQLQKQRSEAAKGTPEEQAARETQRKLDALDNRIAEKERALATGETATRPGQVNRPLAPELEQRKQRLEQLNREIAIARKGGVKTPDELALERYRKAVIRSTEQIRERIRKGDYSRRVTAEPPADTLSTKLRLERDKVRAQFNEGLVRDEAARQPFARKLVTKAIEASNSVRALMTSFDLSAMLRQGIVPALSHPVKWARAIVPSLKAFASPVKAAQVMEQINARPNAPLYRRAGLFLAEEGSSLSKMEEAYMSRWARKIPGVGASERAYVTFLNKLRADLFDSLHDNLLGSEGAATLEQSKALAHYVNAATGRGDLGRLNAAASGLNSILFSPRFGVARVQLLTGHPILSAPKGVRLQIAKEYARTLAGIATVYSIANLAGFQVGTDPKSSDFGKIKLPSGGRIDPVGGFLQWIVFANRIAQGKTTTIKGATVPIRGPAVKFGGTTGADVIGRFVRSKLAPVPSAIVNAATGKDVVGNQTSLANEAKKLITPISSSDVWSILQSEGVPAGTVESMLSIMGVNIQYYNKPQKVTGLGASPPEPIR